METKTLYKNLNAPLNKAFVLHRQHDNIDYIAGYVAIEQANRIFGYENWGYLITKQPELIKEKDLLDKPYWFFTCSVKSWVRINGRDIEREDVGIGEVTFTKQYKDKKGKEQGGRPQLEVAQKGAVTDALKRALRAWGNQFGNSLYDREDKLPAMKATLSTIEETDLAKYVQQLLEAKTPAELETTLDGLVQIAKQEEWNAGQLTYIKNVAERAKAGILARDTRAKNRKEKQAAAKKASEVSAATKGKTK